MTVSENDFLLMRLLTNQPSQENKPMSQAWPIVRATRDAIRANLCRTHSGNKIHISSFQRHGKGIVVFFKRVPDAARKLDNKTEHRLAYCNGEGYVLTNIICEG